MSPRSRAKVVRTIGWVGLLLVTVMSVVFVVFSVLPSDPARNALGMNASPGAVEALRHQLGLDRPIAVRYLRFLADAGRFRFGRSIHSGEEVRPMVIRAFGITARNGALAALISIPGSLALVALAVLSRRGGKVVTHLVRLITSVPSVVVTLCAGMAVQASLGNGVSADERSVAALIVAVAAYPTCSLAELGIAEARRLEGAAFVTAARSIGMREVAIFLSVTLRVILVTWAGHLSNILSAMFVSSAVFEAVMSVPGVGDLLVRSVLANDLPVVQAIVALVTVAFLLLDLLLRRGVMKRVAIYRPDPA